MVGNTDGDRLLLRSLSRMSRNVYAHTKYLVHKQILKVIHEQKVLCRPKELLIPDSHLAMSHSHRQYNTVSDYDVIA